MSATDAMPRDIQAAAWDQIIAILRLVHQSYDPDTGYEISHPVLNNVLWAVSDLADRGAAAFDAEHKGGAR